MAVDGHHILVFVGYCQDGVVGKDSTQVQAGEGCVDAEFQHEGGLFSIGVLDERQVPEQGMVGIGGCGKLNACVDYLAITPFLINMRIQVEYRQVRMHLLQRGDGLVVSHGGADGDDLIVGKVIDGESLVGLDGCHFVASVTGNHFVGQVSVQVTIVEEAHVALVDGGRGFARSLEGHATEGKTIGGELTGIRLLEEVIVVLSVHFVGPLGDVVVPWRDVGLDNGGVVLVAGDEDQRLCCVGRCLSAERDVAGAAGLNLEEGTMGGQLAERLNIGERRDERLDGAFGGRHLRGYQTGVFGVPRPADLSVFCRTDGDDYTVEHDGGAVAAAIVGCGGPFGIFQAAKLDDVGMQAG